MKNYAKLLLGIVFIFVASTTISPNAFAASTKTWDGSECLATADCNWSTGDNWVGGVAPVDGDSIVFPFTAANMPDVVNDIPGLSINTITFSESDYAYNEFDIQLDEPIVITSAIINHTGGSGSSSNDIVHIYGLITLGGDVSVQTDSPLWLLGESASSDSIVDLNGHKLSLITSANVVPPPNQSEHLFLYGAVFGEGIVEIDNVDGVILLTGLNTYTGFTYVYRGTILSDNIIIPAEELPGGIPNFFGESMVFVFNGEGDDGSMMFISNEDLTIDNEIVVYGADSLDDLEPHSTGGFDVGIGQALGFLASGSPTFTVPSISLFGYAFFLTSGTNIDDAPKTNINGIKLYDYEIDQESCDTLRFVLVDEENEESPFTLTDDPILANFIYTPDACPVPETPAIKPPNTSRPALEKVNPYSIIVIGISSIVALLLVKRYSTRKK